MPKKDLRSSFQEQLNAAGRVAPVEEIEAIADSSGLLAYTGVSAVSSATATASTLLSGRYAYDPDEVIWEDAGKVHDNPWQTRSDGYADPAQLEDLIESFNAKGQLQPFVVRPHPDQVLHPGEFQQAFGHRRKYTVKVGKANAGTGRPDARNLIGKVPFVVRAMTDSDMVEAVIDENENRENPKPMDQARGYSNLQLVVSNEMADEGLIRRLPNRKLERLAAWREVANRRQRKYRTLARGASLMQLPKEIRDQFDEPGNW